MEQIECISDDVVPPAALAKGRLERLKPALPLLIENHGFHIEHGILCLEFCDGRSYPRKLGRPVEPVPSAQTDFAAGEKTEKAVAVKFDLMQPFLSFGRRINQRGKLHAR